MHKKIKHIIAVTLVIGAVSGVLPGNDFVLGTATAYAATYNGAGNGELSSLTISRSTGTELELRDSYYGSEVSLTSKSDYYIELSGADGFQISAEVKGSGYVIKQFTSNDKTQKGEDVGEYINVDSTYEDIYLRTYKSEDAYKEAYDNGDVTDCEKTYIIHVKKPIVNSDEELDADYAYLRNIYLSDGSISFSKSKMSYDVKVNEDVQEILIRATPEDDDYTVDINDSSVEKDGNYEKTIKLDKGNNTINIDVESNDDKETYTLNVFRGNSTTSTNAATVGTSSSASDKQTFEIQSDTNQFNVWKRVNENWRYIDGTGQTLKNQWWYDKNTGKNYYLKENGDMATGWLSNNSNWYYFNPSGEMQTGWIYLNNNWYYLNKSGVMKMGWLQDGNGNWYYLDGSGAMKTGSITDDTGKSYYLDSTGKMITNPVVVGEN